MATNLAESLTSVLKKMRNFPITALVRATHEKLNKYFVDHGTQANAMIASEQVYTLIAVKFITEEETKSNIHFVQQFDCQSFQFQVKEIVNSRERLWMKKFTEAGSKNMWLWEASKAIHVIAACKYINIEYL